jgi:hypothetical protein
MPIKPEIAIEAGELVLHAYDQYAAWKTNQHWQLDAAYDLVFELYAYPTPEFSALEIWGFIAVNCKTKDTFVVIRGTEPKSLADLLADAACSQVEHPHGRVHRGFDFITQQILSTVQLVIGDLFAYYTGHSAGAAVATQVSDAFTPDKARAITFASPMMANPQFARQYKIPSLRFTNVEDDEVPKVPESIPDLLEYEHVCPPTEFTRRGTPLEAHAMQTYLDGVKALVSL